MRAFHRLAATAATTSRLKSSQFSRVLSTRRINFFSSTTTTATATTTASFSSSSSSSSTTTSTTVQAATLAAALFTSSLLVQELTNEQHEYTHLQSSSPFIYDELTEGLKQRARAESELQKYLAQIKLDFHRIRVKSRSEQEFHLEMARLKEKVLKDQQRITFGVIDPHAREKYLNQYGCCRWTPRAISLIQKLSLPLLEIGAGAGQWQKELTNNNINILSYDDYSNASLPGRCGVVHVGGVEQIHIHSERVLFLCYPPEGTMAYDCLQSYKHGEYFVYVGEGRQGVNGSNEFFNMLETEWEIIEMDVLDPFPQCFERLYIFKRK